MQAGTVREGTTAHDVHVHSRVEENDTPQSAHPASISQAGHIAPGAASVVAHHHHHHHHHHNIYVYVHGGLMLAAFGFIIPAGIFISRYGKARVWWFRCHRAVQVVGYATVTAGFLMGLGMHKLQHYMEQPHVPGRRLLHDDIPVLHDAAWKRRHNVFLVHKYVGITIFLAMSLQVLAATVKRPRKDSKLRNAWVWAHWGVGWAVLAAGLGNDASGLVLMQPLSMWWIVGLAALAALIAGLVLIVEIRQCIFSHTLEDYKQADKHEVIELVGAAASSAEERCADSALV